MAQGHKRGSRFSLEFKQKILKRVIEGKEDQQAVATDVKMSPKTLFNWVNAHRKGRLPLTGPITATRKKPGPTPAKTRRKRRTKEQMKEALGVTVHKTKGSKATNATILELKVQRLEAELAFIRKDRAILENMLEALS